MLMKFQLEEIYGKPTAVFEDENRPRGILLPHFLPSSLEVLRELLHEIAMVESSRHSSEFESSVISGGIYLDRLEIEAYLEEDAKGNHPKIEIPLDDIKLLLYEWGAALQRWQMQRKQIVSGLGNSLP